MKCWIFVNENGEDWCILGAGEVMLCDVEDIRLAQQPAGGVPRGERRTKVKALINPKDMSGLSDG